MRRTLGAAGIALLALMLAATPALAIFTVHQEGRKTDYSYQLGNPDLGAVVNVKAGNLYGDQNDADGRDDYLRGGDRFTKISHALRIQIDFVQTEERLHPGKAIMRGLDARFRRQLYVEAPYFFPDLTDTSEGQEQAAIDAGLIRAGGIRYAATRT